MYNVQCTMYNVQCTMYNVQCTCASKYYSFQCEVINTKISGVNNQSKVYRITLWIEYATL